MHVLLDVSYDLSDLNEILLPWKVCRVYVIVGLTVRLFMVHCLNDQYVEYMVCWQ